MALEPTVKVTLPELLNVAEPLIPEPLVFIVNVFASDPEKLLAVIVPAEKLPEASLDTIVLTVLLLVALDEIVTIPVEAFADNPTPEVANEVTPVLVIVTIPVEFETFIPVPAISEVTPVLTRVRVEPKPIVPPPDNPVPVLIVTIVLNGELFWYNEPVKFRLPEISSEYLGLVVPIPTLLPVENNIVPPLPTDIPFFIWKLLIAKVHYPLCFY